LGARATKWCTLALPSWPKAQLAGGSLATYVEGIARAQFGNRDVSDVWAEYRHSMPLGLPHDRGRRNGSDADLGAHLLGRSLYCLQTDIRIREQTGNRVGLQTALRAILQKPGDTAPNATLTTCLRIGDGRHGARECCRISTVRSRRRRWRPISNCYGLASALPNDPKSRAFDDHGAARRHPHRQLPPGNRSAADAAYECSEKFGSRFSKRRAHLPRNRGSPVSSPAHCVSARNCSCKELSKVEVCRSEFDRGPRRARWQDDAPPLARATRPRPPAPPHRQDPSRAQSLASMRSASINDDSERPAPMRRAEVKGNSGIRHQDPDARTTGRK